MIPVTEIVDVLRMAARGELPITCVGATWNDTYAGDVEFRLGDWKIEIFNDCDSFDYINWVEAPDGRRATFEDWWEGKETPDCPEQQLSEDELSKLTELLEAAE